MTSFYRHAIPDPVLGPIFRASGTDWTTHVPRIEAFWARELLDEPGYAGNLATAHRRVHDRAPFGPVELDRWVELFEETADSMFVGSTTERAKQRARQVAIAIQGAVDRRPLLQRKEQP